MQITVSVSVASMLVEEEVLGSMGTILLTFGRGRTYDQETKV